MSNFFDKEDAANIAMLNMALGSKHRTKPYDLTSPEDLEHLLLYTVAACMDYHHYWLELEDLIENMDESLEYYDPASWINMNLHPKKTDGLAMEAISSLSETADLFCKLSKRAEKNLTGVLKILLSLSREFQIRILGEYYNIRSEELDKCINELIENFLELEYHYNMEKNRDAFLKYMKLTIACNDTHAAAEPTDKV